MMDKVCEWNSDLGCLVTRDATAEEQAEIDARRNRQPSAAEHNAPILDALSEIDKKSIRALRDALSGGSSDRVIELEQQAAALRQQLRKDQADT